VWAFVLGWGLGWGGDGWVFESGWGCGGSGVCVYVEVGLGWNWCGCGGGRMELAWVFAPVTILDIRDLPHLRVPCNVTGTCYGTRKPSVLQVMLG
jgi:hypothetical protein